MRLARQGITVPRFESAEAVVRWLGAVQSQEYDVARWSLGQRAIGESDASVEHALAEGRILRTHVMRPTWHFVSPEDIRWMVELSGPRIRRAMAYYDRQLDLDAKTLARCHKAIVTALADAGSMTRAQAGAALSAAGIEASGQRLGHILMHAELACLVCSGPRKGKQQTYALFDQRVPGSPSLPRDEALAELTRRFFTGHGPASAKDFSVWANLTLSDVRRGLEMLGPEVDSFAAGGFTLHLIDKTPLPAQDPPRGHLIQGYDEYIMGYYETKAVFGYGSFGSVLDGGRTLTHALLIDGRVVGHWRRNQAPRALAIDLQLYRRLDGTEIQAVEAAIERYGEFVGLPASLGAIQTPE